MQWCRRFQRRTSPRPVREIVRPARPDRGCEREKVRPARSKWPKISVFWRAGRTLSRASMRRRVAGRVFSRVEWGRGCTGRILSRLPAPSPYFVVPPAPPHQSQWGFGSIRSWLLACRRRVGASCSAIPPSGVWSGARTCRGPGGRTYRLAVLILQCAAKPT